jgi:hypothetical protein
LGAGLAERASHAVIIEAAFALERAEPEAIAKEYGAGALSSASESGWVMPFGTALRLEKSQSSASASAGSDASPSTPEASGAQ